MLEWTLLFCIAISDGKSTCARTVFPTRRECIAAVDSMKTDGFKLTTFLCSIEAKK
jgi:hypothetical protein